MLPASGVAESRYLKVTKKVQPFIEFLYCILSYLLELQQWTLHWAHVREFVVSS